MARSEFLNTLLTRLFHGAAVCLRTASRPATQQAPHAVAEAYPDGDGAILTTMRRRLERAFIRGVRDEANEHLLGRSLGELAEERGREIGQDAPDPIDD